MITFFPALARFALPGYDSVVRRHHNLKGEQTMASISIVTRLWFRAAGRKATQPAWLRRNVRIVPPNLRQLSQWPLTRFPRFVRESPVALRYVRLLGPLDWGRFPERTLDSYRYCPPVPYAPFVAACLVKLEAELKHMTDLCDYLCDHPALVWVLGFPRIPARRFPWGFDVEASLPTARHFTQMLRTLPNPVLQWLLDDTVRLLQVTLHEVAPDFGQAISLDTKHILAWVAENNPKAYVTDRYAKHKQPTGDPDCRLGCKRKRNQRTTGEPDPTIDTAPATPLHNPLPASGRQVGEYVWGYASGVIATKVPDWGEFVLAELTQPFDQSDVSYFFPLLVETERRLGFRPRFGAFDAAFDAFYVYAHFHRAGQTDWRQAFAAVPHVARGPQLQFDPHGLPLCKAGLPMPLKGTFNNKTSLVPHERGRYACPLRYPELRAEACPVADKHWDKGGCITTLPTSIGARLRHQIDHNSDHYKTIYKQRTATERINSQAKALGIERPKLRNQQAIANQNTLIYVLINLRALHRVRDKHNKRS